MPQGFFASSVKPAPRTNTLVPSCGACGLHKECNSPRMPVTGEGRLGVLIVAEAPGHNEDDEGIQLIGKAGQRLRKVLKKIGVDLDRDCWKTNAVICRPKTPNDANRTPTKQEIEWCRPNLLAAMKELKPRVVILLGGPAMESVIGHLWKPDVGPVGRWVGFQIPCQRPNAWVCPTYHPSYLEREDDGVLDLWFERHLEAAFNLTGRPWQEKQEWDKQVQVVMDDEAAAACIRKSLELQDGAVAFDYETTTIKPDTPWSEIVSCSVCWGRMEPEVTIAFPWRGKAREAMGELIRSPVPKIAQNLKFEQRWTMKEFGHPVRNWAWDTMLAAHTMDNREGICGLKFQAFALLGYPSYNDSVEPFLSAGKGSRGKNKILEADKFEVLRYNGLDAMLEFRLAVKQIQLLGWDYPWRTK
jgi:uracil-DNA glycosylase family 4